MGIVAGFIKFVVYTFFLLLSIPLLYFTYITLITPKVDFTPKEIENDYKELESLVTEKMIFLKNRNSSLAVYEAGEAKNPLVVFIHGYPDTGLVSWKYQIPFFVKKGYYVVAIDIRGSGRSQSVEFLDPKNSNYEETAKDVKELINYYGKSKAYVVSHDWGAGVGFEIGQEFPEVVEKLVILNMMHPKLASVKPSAFYLTKQVLKSWYMFYYQIPQLPEWKMKQNDFTFYSLTLKGAYSAEDMRRLKKYWSQPYALTSMINWYRFVIQNRALAPKPLKTITVPVLSIFGDGDRYIEKNSAALSVQEPFCKNGKIIFYEGISHWIQHEAPDRLNEDILKFITEKK